MNITSKIVALSSAVAFALQIALALMMLRYFSPEEVGTFSSISQIAFFWATLALSQAPLRLLANHGVCVFEDSRLAWYSSIKRFIWLLPIAVSAIWLSGIPIISTLIWVLFLSFSQLSWILAQSMRIRMSSAWAQVGVRILPPLVALLAASVAIFIQCNAHVLLSAALLGYVAGAFWLLQAFLHTQRDNHIDHIPIVDSLVPSVVGSSTFLDDRPDFLRTVHTFFDLLLATAILLVWQRIYGAQETGWMSAPLRLMGFVPALIHASWAQVILAKPKYKTTHPLWIGGSGFAVVAILVLACAVTLNMQWLGQDWQGVGPYLFSLVLWQGSSCLLAACSFVPFKTQSAKRFSYICIFVVGLQISVLLMPIHFGLRLTAGSHFLVFGAVSALAFFCISVHLMHTLHKLAYQGMTKFLGNT